MQWNFNSILTDMKNRLTVMVNWADTLFDSTYDRLFSVISAILEKYTYYAEFLLKESVFSSATKFSSVVNHAKFLGYIPHRKRGAIGEILFSNSPTFDNSYIYDGSNVIIPKWTIFTDLGISSYVYATKEFQYLNGNIGNLVISVREGTPKTFTYIASGNISESFSIYSSNIENEDIEVFLVDSNNVILDTYTVITKFEESTKNANTDTGLYCRIENLIDYNGITLTFGDGDHTKRINSNDRILVKYSDTIGSYGNIQQANYIARTKDPLLDVNGNTFVPYVTNTDSISDGSDTETISSIKTNAPEIFQAGYLANSQENYMSIVNNYPAVYRSLCWTDVDTRVYTDITKNNVYITAVSLTGDPLTTAQKKDLLENYLNPKKSATEVVTYKLPIFIYLKMSVTAKLISSASKSVVRQKIKDAVYDKYNVLNCEFKTDIYGSNATKIVDNLSEIIWNETSVWNLEKGFSASVGVGTPNTISSFSSGNILPTDDILLSPNSFEVWLKLYDGTTWASPLLIAHDVSGVLTATDIYPVTSYYLDYPTGEFGFVFNSLTGLVNNPPVGIPGYTIDIAYKTCDGSGLQTNSIRLTNFTAITNVDKDYIFADDVNLTQ